MGSEGGEQKQLDRRKIRRRENQVDLSYELQFHFKFPLHLHHNFLDLPANIFNICIRNAFFVYVFHTHFKKARVSDSLDDIQLYQTFLHLNAHMEIEGQKCIPFSGMNP